MAITSQTPTKRMSFSLRWKLLIGFSLVFTVVFAVAYYWFYTFSTQMALGRIQEDLADTLNAAIDGIDGDVFEALVKSGAPEDQAVPAGDRRYQEHQTWMEIVHKIEPRAVTYSYVKDPTGERVLWVGDLYRITAPEESTAFLEPYTPSKDFIFRGLTEVTVDMKPYPDDWGSWVSAYGPIRNSRGEPIGAVGIDFQADYVVQVQKAIRDSMVMSFFVTYGSLLVLVYIISSVLTKPLVSLAQIAKKIGEGEYNQDLSGLTRGRLKDEISDLAGDFAEMAGKVYQREQTLRRQVEELRIEVDESKRKHQVSEIVDTDFFRELQSKADEMRIRRSKAGTSA
jgi:HAMP domain-containing protein